MAEHPILEKTYDPQAVEPGIYALWEQSGAFRAQPDGRSHERTFTIVIPPPNVTGALHLGHALNNTLQDILIRYYRMRGFNTLWQPGTDHAGIATQAVVERRILQQEGKTRHELGREELVRRIWQWKDEYEKRILNQLKMMGCSCDWERTRFTLDEGLARAVREMFFRLFRDGLIFRGKRLVNWDTELQTAVSDDEVYYETVKGHFWYFKYPVIDPRPGEPEHVLIATTRPETMLGDTAVAVHPDPEAFFDARETDLRKSLDRLSSRSAEEPSTREAVELKTRIDDLRARRQSHLQQLIQLRDMVKDGRRVLLPLVEREIPLIADKWADPTLGTGCVKITPAHDPNDYEVGLRHDLPMVNVLTPDGKIARIVEANGHVNAHSRDYEGLTFSGEGRMRVVADLEARGLVEKVEDHEVEIGHSDRSKRPIEPYLSDQWFLRTDDLSGPRASARGSLEGTMDDGGTGAGLAQRAIHAVEHGRIQVFPSRYAKSYLDWLSEKRDWCISRQLWWGHRICVWTLSAVSGRSRVDPRELEGDWHELRIVRAGDGKRRESVFFLACHGEASQSDRKKLTQNGYVEDPDVLDTWFSSALWPFSTLGWPEQTDHLRQYYPGSVLCTSRDIITNWVARMVMFGLYAMGEVPFDHVYIHPKILDGRGETMSKSKGNGVDPVDIIHTHGADAMRYSLADMTTETQDIRMPVEYVCPHCGKLTDQAEALKTEEQTRKSKGEKLERRLQPADCTRVQCAHQACGRIFATQWADKTVQQQLGLGRETSDKFDIGRNFCNKLWNAARFAFMNLKQAPCERIDPDRLPPEDRWILARLSQTIRRYHREVQDYQFSASVKELREFFWDSLCDWYIELAKPRFSSGVPADWGSATRAAWPSMNGTDGSHGMAKQVLALCLDQSLRLWHPTIPFITERLWQQLYVMVPRRGLPGLVELSVEPQLVTAPFPPQEGYPVLDDEKILTVFSEIQHVVRAVRELRARCGVSPKEAVKATVVLPEAGCGAFQAYAHIVVRMAHVSELAIDPHAKRPPNSGSVTKGSLRVFVHDISNDDAERARASKALLTLEKQIAGKEAKLANEKFTTGARPEIVEAERERLAELREQRNALQVHLAELTA